MSGFDSFVAIDLETTGLDPASSEILEFGAVRYINGDLAEEFSELVKPSERIPPEITRLTGISNEMVRMAPDIESLITKYLTLLDNSPWIVGHNVSFDLGFLKPHFPKKKFAMIEARVLDTGVLSRILFPRLPRYSLASLTGYLNISRKRAHRALDDSRATAEAFLKLISHLAAQNVPIKDAVGRLLFGSDSLDYFRSAIDKVKAIPLEPVVSQDGGTSQAAEASGYYPDNITGRSPQKTYDDYIPVDVAAIENCFLPGGLLSKKIAAYEFRSQQAQMAIKIAETFNRSEFLLAEAPTGVGKSLAYLLPASWWSSQNKERVVISTQTKNLQSQLFYKDLPQIQEAINFDFKAVLLKGKSNYICLHKYYELLSEAEISFDKRDREALAFLSLWIRNTKTGDISECNGFSPSQNYFLWSRISCEGSFCLGPACTFADRCFLLKIRREAQNAQIVVTNHHLTFADFAAGGELALGAGNVIFDEAHNLEKVAASYLGNEVDKRALDALLSDMYASRPNQSGYLLNLKMALMYRTDNTDLVKLVDSVIDATTAVGYSSSQFFTKLSDIVQSISRGSETREFPYSAEDNPCDIAERKELVGEIGKLLERLDRLLESVREADNLPKRREAVIRLEAFLSDLKSFGAVVADVLFAQSSEYIYWIEKPSSSRHTPRLLSAPLEVGKQLDKNFYDHLKTAVFTSATLAVDKNFNYIIQRLGLDLHSKDRMMSVCLDSPFNIDSEVAVISAGYLPSPKQGDFEDTANEALKKILFAGARKAMVLFTSHRSLQNSSNTLKSYLEQAGIELFTQEGSHSSDRIFRRFKASKRGVLFGTDTFWEGVDLPGELLELLILFKLPFTVPDRPWFKANLEQIEKNGESSFAKLSLPEAVVKFRQGFGRLIRTANDRGCVVVLDSRIEKNSFGRVFLNSVGGTKYRCKSADEIADIIKKWLK
jgi:predicted DnaQ family exonuclease/DinG family helicase